MSVVRPQKYYSSISCFRICFLFVCIPLGVIELLSSFVTLPAIPTEPLSGDLNIQESSNEYDAYVAQKSKSYPGTCLGWPDYRKLIEELFALAPSAPSCDKVSNFRNVYNDTTGEKAFVKGTLVFSRNYHHHNPAYLLTSPTEPLRGRNSEFAKMWKEANLLRQLPPSLEMLLYPNDKPRVRQDLSLPAFVLAGHIPVGSGHPTEWMNYLPFPSHFFSYPIPQNRTDFWKKKPNVYFRGRFSENIWSRFRTLKHQLNETPRFKLALATSNPADADVLDVRMTGFGVSDEASPSEMEAILKEKYNISMGDYVQAGTVDSRYVLSVSGNGWAGATTMRALLTGSCVLFVNDNSTDYEGYTRDLGEIYFPLMEEGRDFLRVEYNTIASVARRLNAEPQRAFEIAKAGWSFGKKYLGWGCALDVLELLAWSYYEYVRTGCPSAFSHVEVGRTASLEEGSEG